MKSPIPSWKVRVGVGSAVLLVLGVFFIYAHLEGARRWARMERRVRSATPSGLYASQPLAALLNTLPGFVGYDEGWRQLEDFRNGKTPPERARADAVLAKHLPTLEAIRHLARSDSGLRSSCVEVRAIPALETLAVAQSVVLCEAGRYSEAAETLQDCAFVFLSLVGEGGGRRRPLSAVRGTLTELSLLAKPGKINAEALRGLSTALEKLDRRWPQTAYVEMPDVVNLGLEFVNSANLFEDLRKPRCMCLEHACPVWGAWRFGFSDRLMAARAFEEAQSLAELSESVRSAPWSEVRRVRDLIGNRVFASWNPIVRSHVSGLLAFDVSHRETLARIRMLRIAVAIRLGDRPPLLQDPFGNAFGREGLRLWSVGEDGVDDGGHSEKDLVLNLER